MTEEEAKTKWCPFVRQTLEGRGLVAMNRTFNGDATTKCVGSACMAWRGEKKIAHEGLREQHEYDVGGYCGLAGKP